MTTFSIDKATETGVILLQSDNLGHLTPLQAVRIADLIANEDNLLDIISNRAFHRIKNLRAFIETIPLSLVNKDIHPSWLTERHNIAIIEQRANANEPFKSELDPLPQIKISERNPFFRR
jgi:hypothetical protein